jgi:hypothetical protein
MMTAFILIMCLLAVSIALIMIGYTVFRNLGEDDWDWEDEDDGYQ